jgi:hypothetical protein
MDERQHQERSSSVNDSSTFIDWSFHSKTNNSNGEHDDDNNDDADHNRSELLLFGNGDDEDQDEDGHGDNLIMSPQQLNEDIRRGEGRIGVNTGNGSSINNRSRRTSHENDDSSCRKRNNTNTHSPHFHNHYNVADKSVTFDDSITVVGSPMAYHHIDKHHHDVQLRRTSDDNYSGRTTRSDDIQQQQAVNNDQSISSDISLLIDDENQEDQRRPRDNSSFKSYHSQSQEESRSVERCRYQHDHNQILSPSLSSSSLLKESPSYCNSRNCQLGDETLTSPSLSLSLLPILYKERPWPNRREYQSKYESQVKSIISKFRCLHPGVLKDYKSMTPQQKADERQRVLALLARIRSGEYQRHEEQEYDSQQTKTALYKTVAVPTQEQERRHGRLGHLDSTTDTTFIGTQKISAGSDHYHNQSIVDETMSPSINPPALAAAKQSQQTSSRAMTKMPFTSQVDHSVDVADKSELLLSPEGGSNFDDCDSSQISMRFPQADNDDNADNNDRSGPSAQNDSVSSVEIPRGSNDDDDLSYGTPEDQIQRSTESSGALKRQATNSGKRGADSQRSRHDANGIVDMVSSRLSRMSMSPEQSKKYSSSPSHLFPASQSPISLRLTSSSQDANEYSPGLYDQDEINDKNNRISWGTELRYSTANSPVNDSVMTSRSDRSRQNDSRSIREVPTNVSLIDGAIFHLDKLSVQRTKQLDRSRTAKHKDHSHKGISALRCRRLVSFPDPFLKYNNRVRKALNEMHQWIHGAEFEFDQGESNIPALGVFFSLSYQQIVDLGLKLLLGDLSRSKPGPSLTTMNGSTIIVCRSREDCEKWESAFRDGTGCSVLNHAILPLSERIRTSTAEKACLHDVVLTTFDAMKSPDVTMPVSGDGYVIFKSATAARGWHSSRSGPQIVESTQQKTKQLSVLHRVHYKRIIFVDVIGRKCFLAKGGTARNAAATALSGDSRLAFFSKSEADGTSALAALKKSDKTAFSAVSAALRLSSYENPQSDDRMEEDSSDDDDDGRNSRLNTSTLATIALDLNDLK